MPHLDYYQISLGTLSVFCWMIYSEASMNYVFKFAMLAAEEQDTKSGELVMKAASLSIL